MSSHAQTVKSDEVLYAKCRDRATNEIRRVTPDGWTRVPLDIVKPSPLSFPRIDMRRVHGLTVATAALTALTFVTAFTPALAQDQTKAVAGGGISAPGWMGQIDPGGRQPLSSSKLVKEGDVLHVTTGPAVSYWNPANKASG